MPKIIAPYLLEKDGIKRCSVCGIQFPDDTKPSVSKAFVQHVRDAHQGAAKNG